MCASQLFLSADLSLGRVDYSLMSDQSLMEMLIDGLDDEIKEKYQDNNGMYIDVCGWSITRCDDHDRVIEVNIDIRYANGSVDFCYIPPKVKKIYVGSGNKSSLTGSLDLTNLPDGMQYFQLHSNELTGETDLTQLPHGIQFLDLRNNKLRGGNRLNTTFAWNNMSQPRNK